MTEEQARKLIEPYILSGEAATLAENIGVELMTTTDVQKLLVEQSRLNLHSSRAELEEIRKKVMKMCCNIDEDDSYAAGYSEAREYIFALLFPQPLSKETIEKYSPGTFGANQQRSDGEPI